MRLAIRSHLSTHPMKRHHIGAGIVREICQVCPHISIAETTVRSARTTDRTIPGWMSDAAERFDDTILQLFGAATA